MVERKYSHYLVFWGAEKDEKDTVICTFISFVRRFELCSMKPFTFIVFVLFLWKQSVCKRYIASVSPVLRLQSRLWAIMKDTEPAWSRQI